ncbi:helix-turn-helix domain-containing protein [Patulibacter defluvii]|uniref:helix-turn-helix domain-containing protein n=1 Tax=Patulibacter defluvii TaxID=3095358 RepID=UPI002A75C307|nr:helix-turn-helix domain-containing protein [Patulibacter sp. DM4]
MSPTQAERSQATTALLVSTARELFAARGYPGTSLDDVVARAGVTKGALYHHFANKRELFRAVYEREQERLMAAVIADAEVDGDVWERVEAACVAFLDHSLDREVQQITLLDAPAALGWEQMRAIEGQGSYRLLHEALEWAIAEGLLAPRPVEPLARLLFGALCEAAMAVARADDQPTAARETREELERLLQALRA